MTYVALAQTVVLVALVALIYALERRNSLERSERASAYEKTLQSMATRIQHPQLVPQERPETFPTPEPEVDEIELVGTIAYPDGD